MIEKDRVGHEETGDRAHSEQDRRTRVVERLALARFDTELFVIIWRRDPYSADGPLLHEASRGLRSVAVKRVALRALEALP
jgi:hypothetical protein